MGTRTVFDELFGVIQLTVYCLETSLKKLERAVEFGSAWFWSSSENQLQTFSFKCKFCVLYMAWIVCVAVFSLYLACPEVEHFTLWTLLWVVGTTDFVVKFITMIVKAVIALLPRQVMPLKKKVWFFAWYCNPLFVEYTACFDLTKS